MAHSTNAVYFGKRSFIVVSAIFNYSLILPTKKVLCISGPKSLAQPPKKIQNSRPYFCTQLWKVLYLNIVTVLHISINNFYFSFYIQKFERNQYYAVYFCSSNNLDKKDLTLLRSNMIIIRNVS